jgi:hypothetical protein
MGQTRTVHVWASLIEQSVDNEHQRIHTTKIEMVNKLTGDARSDPLYQTANFADLFEQYIETID